jgi:xylulose-5-phosphate/fructose-6-phosphate phosphoketolase
MTTTQNHDAGNHDAGNSDAGSSLTSKELRVLDGYWRACNYLCAGMIYLRENVLLKMPLQPAHVKNRLLGHWGTDPGQTFIWTHLNRVIRKYDLDMIYIAGPGHGAPAMIANSYLEGTYSEIYPEKSQNEAGMRRLFQAFSFPGQLGSHCTPEVPGSIHEGGELGYSLSHGFGAAFDNPDLIVSVVIGDGEAETGPLATSWHSNKFLNPVSDGAVLPILHLNGYKINNPSLLARVTPGELEALLRGYGWTPYFVEGDDPKTMHQKMASTVESCIRDIRASQSTARLSGSAVRPRWPMIVLRSPKGWTGPREVDGHKVENFWRAHQVPVLDVKSKPEHLSIVERWMHSYHPEELFDERGTLFAEFAANVPTGVRRMTANPHANGGKLRQALELPDFHHHAVQVTSHGTTEVRPTEQLGKFLCDVMRHNMKSFRVFSPDENASNRLQDIYNASWKTWLAEIKPEDADGTFIAPSGRVMEMLSEHTLEGWLEGYLLSGRHGVFSTYEAFAHVIDSMFNQFAKWLEKSKFESRWRPPISALNLLITSVVWRQDHNGFSHEDPGFLDVASNKSPEVVRIYLPPDANCLLSVMDHCLRSENVINVIVADKEPHLVYLSIEEAIVHCQKGVSRWQWASSDIDAEPDVVVASAGDVLTQEALAAVALLRENIPKLKVRFLNVVDLYRLMSNRVHKHGLSDDVFDSLFTKDKPVIFNFHGYPALIHKLTYQRTNHANIHVHGYHEMGNINTPLELAIRNKVDRFHLALDVIDRVPGLGQTQVAFRSQLEEKIADAIRYAYAEGIDRPEIRQWKWTTS